jgi:hypothetical protein
VNLIGFSGHRDRRADEALLRALAAEFRFAHWLHGGAPGFDSQVDDLGRSLGKAPEVLRPRYKDIPAGWSQDAWVKVAPLVRNEELVRRLVGARRQGGESLLVVLWDGRKTGGTHHTKEYAELWRVPVRVWAPVGRAVE